MYVTIISLNEYIIGDHEGISIETSKKDRSGKQFSQRLATSTLAGNITLRRCTTLKRAADTRETGPRVMNLHSYK